MFQGWGCVGGRHHAAKSARSGKEAMKGRQRTVGKAKQPICRENRLASGRGRVNCIDEVVAFVAIPPQAI